MLAERRFVPATEVLALLAARMLSPGGAWTHQEDARITRSALTAMATCTSVDDATAWLSTIAAGLDTFGAEPATESGPVAPQAWVHNTTMTCSKLHLALHLETNAEQIAPQVRDAVTAQLRHIALRVESYIAL